MTDVQVDPSYVLECYQAPDKYDGFHRKIREFCDAVRENKPAPIPADEILYNQAICDGIYRSSKLRKEVETEILGI